MVEVWFKSGGSKLAKWTARPRRWAAFVPLNAWIVISVVALFAGRIAWIKADRQPHLFEITAAFGGVRLLQNPPQFSHDFKRFTYVTTTDARGVGVFLGETETGKKQLIDTQKTGPGPWRDDFDLKVWPWAPDNSAFVYGMTGSLVVRPLDTNQPPFRFPLGTNLVADLVWLNPRQFVWKEQDVLVHAFKGEAADWAVQRISVAGRGIKGLTAIDANSIAWVEDDYICRMEVTPESFESSQNRPLSTAISPVKDGLVMWLDASSLNLPNRAPVNFLADKSPSQNGAVPNLQPPLFNAPGSDGALNGRGTIRFSSSNAVSDATGLRTTNNLGIAGRTPRTAFAVLRRDVGRSMIAGTGNAGVGGAYFALSDQFDGMYLPSTMSKDNKFPAPPRAWNVLSVVFDGTNHTGYLNGQFKGTIEFPLNTADAPVEIGVRSIASGQKWRAATSDGDFAELLIYNRALDASELRQMQKYLSAKWFGANHLLPESPLVWQNPGLEGVTQFLYSPLTKQFVLTATGPSSGSLWRYDPAAAANAKLTKLTTDPMLGDAQRIGPEELIYAGSENGRRQLFSLKMNGNAPGNLMKFQRLDWFKAAPAQSKLFIWGSISNEPAPGLWEYDTVTKGIRTVVSYSDKPSPHAQQVSSSTAQIKVPSGKTLTVTVFTPPRFDRNKKYPLVLGDTYVPDAIHGVWLHSGIAAGGAIVAYVNRPYWTANIENWEEDVRALYEVLKVDPSIDTRRVYLIGASAETRYMRECIEKTPGLWRGAILLNPSSLPDFSKSPPFESRPAVFISTGAEERQDERFQQFQQKSLPAGVFVEYLSAPGETHRFIGNDGKAARLKALHQFIFGQ